MQSIRAQLARMSDEQLLAESTRLQRSADRGDQARARACRAELTRRTAVRVDDVQADDPAAWQTYPTNMFAA